MQVGNRSTDDDHRAADAPDPAVETTAADPSLARLRALPILGEVERSALERVARAASWHRYQPDAQIYSENDPSTDIWFVVEGRVRIVLQAAGRELIIDEFGSGQMFGEISAIDGDIRTTSVSAVTRAALCSVPSAIFLDAARSTPAAFHALLRALARALRRRVKRLGEREALPARLRLCAELLRLSRARSSGEAGQEHIISPPPPHHVLAARIGSSRETVSRELGQLMKEGLVHRSQRAYLLPKPAALRGALGSALECTQDPEEAPHEIGADKRRYHWHVAAHGGLQHLLRPAATLALVGVLGGCSTASLPHSAASGTAAPPAGFSSDTTTWEGLARGATATEEACHALPNAVWVRAGERAVCLRYATTGFQGPVGTVVVHLGGDPPSASYIFLDGRVQMHRSGPGRPPSIPNRRGAVEAMDRRSLLPVIFLARPGMEGSSGNHPADRHTTAEVLFIDDALSQLKTRLGFSSLSLAGFSSGGTLAANLLSRRSDIRCAVLDSAPLDLNEFYRGGDGTVGFRTPMGRDLADPMQSVTQMQSPAMIWVVGDPRDRKVPAPAWLNWAAAARHRGASVVVAHLAPRPADAANPRHSYHRESSLTLRIASACATGRRMEASRTTLRSRVAGPAALNARATSGALDNAPLIAATARAHAEAVDSTGAGGVISDTEGAHAPGASPLGAADLGAGALGPDVVVDSLEETEEAPR